MFSRLYTIGGAIIIASLAIAYHTLKISSLNSRIKELEKDNISYQHKYINCEQNLTTLNGIIDKQNLQLKNISNEFESNLSKFNIWTNQEDRKKYSDKILNLLNSGSTTDIVKQLNQIDFEKEIKIGG